MASSCRIRVPSTTPRPPTVLIREGSWFSVPCKIFAEVYVLVPEITRSLSSAEIYLFCPKRTVAVTSLIKFSSLERSVGKQSSW